MIFGLESSTLTPPAEGGFRPGVGSLRATTRHALILAIAIDAVDPMAVRAAVLDVDDGIPSIDGALGRIVVDAIAEGPRPRLVERGRGPSSRMARAGLRSQTFGYCAVDDSEMSVSVCRG